REWLSVGMVMALSGCALEGADNTRSADSKADAVCNSPVVGVREVPFFPGLSFSVPTSFVRTPDNKQGVITEKGGVIKAFPNLETAQASDVHVMINLTPLVNSSAREPGVNGIVFHPSWPQVPEAYNTYDGFPPGQSGPNAGWEWRMSRFLSRDGGATL